MSSHPMLLIVGSGPELMCRNLLEAAAAEHPVLLLNARAPSWERPYVVAHEVADLHDLSAVTAAAEALAGQWNIAGVLTFDASLLLTVARLAEHLGLPGNSPAAVGAARDKATSRQSFMTSDVPSAASTWVHSMAAAASAAERIGGYPVVLKPAAHADSAGVVRVDTITDLPAAWSITCAAAAAQGPDGEGVLLEEFLDGPEISVTTVTQNGQTRAVAVIHKTVAFAPHLVETAHGVTAGDPLLPTVAPIAAAALRAVGITHGVSHVEMRLTDTGPRLIEVNIRFGGDSISQLVRHATGVDLVRAAAAIACGQIPDLEATQACSAAIGMLYPPGDGTVTARELTGGSDEHVEQFHWLCEVGDQVTLTPSAHVPNSIQAAFGIVTGRTAEEARAHLRALLARTVLRIRPVTADAA
ncbi:ATP-grasp domain-containing protein [Streptomyces sp. H10-C2]|uniref:ATP-grasp domain-containing protein n=1 Tax=unclassified Streptomyces TaxID=2593676 RepID=UPI0024BA12DD|nr:MULTISPECIES: ATP-grasp domain-containing protein [unclassified Streptomyces]MDJ0346702.1 ATP-grasp domain-containing protein [Streptomyces sp. PH10-H1]MDJ0374610.1 ATP-grasp domain-containing protein [Streptomyces sp. H10-C2]